MKILYINNFFSNFGGAEKTMYNEARLLQSQGIETYFFATDKQPYFIENYEYAKYFPKYINYREISKFEALLNVFRPFYNIEAEKKLDKYLKEIKPDVVRCCNIYYHLTPSIIRACRKNNVPVVMSIHDCRLFCPSGNLMLKNKEYCRELLCMQTTPAHCVFNLCKDNRLIPSMMGAFEFMFNRFLNLYKEVDAFICQSEAMMELAIKSGIKSDKVFLLNTFLDESYFEIESEYENNDYFLYIGRISREKGIDILINAAKNISDITVHIVGTGPEEEYYKQYVQKNNMHNVKFLGFKTGEELEKEYKNCIATVLPCNWFENFPRSVLESFAYGKPSIASRIGGIPEIIDDGINGYTFEVGSHKKLAEYMKMLHNMRELSTEMGKNAREKAKKQYNLNLYQEKVLKIYNFVVKS